MKTLLTTVFVLLLFVPSCLLPDGEIKPSFEVTIDGKRQTYDTNGTAFTVGESVWSLVLNGSADPIPDAVDDEHSDAIRLEFDAKLLANVSTNTAYTIAGVTTTSDDSQSWINPDTLEFAPGPNHLKAVSLVYFFRSCFCFSDNAGFKQSWSGFVSFTEISKERLAGTLTLHMSGDIQFFWSADGAPQKVYLQASFDVKPK